MVPIRDDLEAPLIDEFSMESREDVEDDLSEDEGELMARREMEAHSTLRSAVVATMLAFSLLISVGIFSFALAGERNSFDLAYTETVSLLSSTLVDRFHHQVKSVQGLALDLQSYATNTNGQWPEVTMEDFRDHVEITQFFFDFKCLFVTPIVNDAEKWDEYTKNKLGRWKNKNAFGDVERKTPARVQKETSNVEMFNINGSRSSGRGPFAPLWQSSNSSRTDRWVNLDVLSVPIIRDGILAAISSSEVSLSRIINVEDASTLKNPAYRRFVQDISEQPVSNTSSPVSILHVPVTNDQDETVAVVSVFFEIRSLFQNLLPLGRDVVDCAVQSMVGQIVSYKVDGQRVDFIGHGDLHAPQHRNLNKTLSLSLDTEENVSPTYRVSIYPSTEMYGQFINGSPILLSGFAVLIFFVTGVVFYFYDSIVKQRQKFILDQAIRSNAILSSLFPENVRGRLFGREEGSTGGGTRSGASVNSNPLRIDTNSFTVDPTKMRLKSFLSDVEQNTSSSKPIADLFPNCTVLFADISGFTAWSSLRDAGQVFTLLENVYQEFDKIAKKRGVFKVETIGDSYVAVTGLPDPQEDHAVIMAKFAMECRQKMNEITHRLELSLGPDTGDLRMRFGLHSGPVTAGVLRGEKSRFQLFGDTVNTAARMESTGMRDKIQCSQATADCLSTSGKGYWVTPRDTIVHAKGKGELQTFFIDATNTAKQRRRNSNASQSSALSNYSGASGSQRQSVIWGQTDEIPEYDAQRSKHQRLIDYNVDLMKKHLRHIVARRKVLNMAGRRCSQGGHPPQLHPRSDEVSTVLEEVTEIIRLPSFNARAYKKQIDPETIDLGPAVESQLKRYVSIIAAMYRNNPFHNFEHASHVTMSVNKLLQRVVEPNITVSSSEKGTTSQSIASNLHNYTFGITSDPLTQFAIVFAALIHDSDHWGISNAQMIKEGAAIANKYRNKSIAEQNSVDLAWDLLMDSEEYSDLQRCIFPTDAEYKRFRQVVVNVVMATDIFDAELLELRTARWNKTFREKDAGEEADPDDENRKATIVIEHIMQASDVAHTMQHWHVYQKWNRRLFDELYTAWKAGRMSADPANFWYKGELTFFDTYIIPLAKKLNDCKVFGVSSDECLSYAVANRNEWESKGQQIVMELVSNWSQREKEESEKGEPPLGQGKRKGRRISRRRSLITTGG